MLIDQEPLKVNRLPYLFKNMVKPNFTCSASKKLQIKALGFTWSLVNAASLEKVVFFCYFHVFGSIRSTQPMSSDIRKRKCGEFQSIQSGI